MAFQDLQNFACVLLMMSSVCCDGSTLRSSMCNDHSKDYITEPAQAWQRVVTHCIRGDPCAVKKVMMHVEARHSFIACRG